MFVHLQEPRLTLVINDDINSKDLERFRLMNLTIECGKHMEFLKLLIYMS
jgi:hypothetical protein